MSISTVNVAQVAWNQWLDESNNYHSPSEWPNHNSRVDSFENPISDLYSWEDDDDTIKKKADTDGLVQRITTWNTSHGVVSVELVTDDEYREHLATMRSKQALTWINSADETLQELGKVACQVWHLNDDGTVSDDSIAVIKYVANMAYRRGFAIPAVIAVGTYGVEDGEQQYTYDLPIHVREFESEDERFQNHIEENFKEGGRSMYTQFELYDIALRWVRMGGIEADLVRKGLKRGTAQKLYLLASIENARKSLNIGKRIRMPSPGGRLTPEDYKAGGYIPLSKVKPQELRPIKVGIVNNTLKVSDVELYIKDLFAPSVNVNAPKIMPKDRLTAVRENHACTFVRVVTQMVLTNDDNIREKLSGSADLFNDLVDHLLIELGLHTPQEEETQEDTFQEVAS